MPDQDSTQPAQTSQNRLLPTTAPEPVTPVFQDPNIISPPPSQTSEIPVVQTTQDQSNNFSETPEPFYKNKTFIIIAAILGFLILSAGGVYAYLSFVPHGTIISERQYQDALSYTPIPVPSFVSSTVVPIATPVEFRNPKGTASDVINLSLAAQKNLGVIQVPNNLNFIHSEIYKGIPIKWTAGQPILDDRLQWLRDAIDKAPDFYTKNYPPQAIISATTQELQMDAQTSSQSTISLAAASGTNIFLWPSFFTNGDKYSYYQTVDEKLARHTLMHEWMHIVQYYDGVETYTDDYIIHNIAGGLDLDYKAPIVKRFGDAVGWYYPNSDSPVPTLKTDAQSQKTNDYGKTQEYEDMAESAAFVITCDTSQISQTRIDIISQIFGQSAQSFCQ